MVFDLLPEEVILENLAPAMHAADVGRLRRVSKGLFKLMSSEELWMEKITVLVLEHPVLSDMDKGLAESWCQWYSRLFVAVSDGSSLALKHKAVEYPFLSMHGTMSGTTFTPFASPLRFPIQRGFIAELIHYFK